VTKRQREQVKRDKQKQKAEKRADRKSNPKSDDDMMDAPHQMFFDVDATEPK
jgi:hypothetical protein